MLRSENSFQSTGCWTFPVSSSTLVRWVVLSFRVTEAPVWEQNRSSRNRSQYFYPRWWEEACVSDCSSVPEAAAAQRVAVTLHFASDVCLTREWSCDRRQDGTSDPPRAEPAAATSPVHLPVHLLVHRSGHLHSITAELLDMILR